MSNPNGKSPRPTPKLQDVCFYFDGVERDRLDGAGLTRRSAEILALRQRLLQLPEAEFDAAMQTLRALVDAAPGGAREETRKGERQSRAESLYDSVRPSGGGGGLAKAGKVSPAG